MILRLLIVIIIKNFLLWLLLSLSFLFFLPNGSCWETDRRTDRQTERDRETETETKIGRDRERQRDRDRKRKMYIFTPQQSTDFQNEMLT